jgi:TPR repeat protein
MIIKAFTRILGAAAVTACLAASSAQAGVVEDTRAAAEQGNALAQDNLGVMYVLGQGVLQDDVEALKWFRMAAEQGDAGAQYHLAGMYTDGRGVPQDYAEAMKWGRRAAEQGNADAQISLGFRYYEGEGVPQDYILAHMWSNLAAVQGNSQARGIRDMVAQGMTREQIAEAQRLAREWKPKPE